jgi:hypothetical protein
LARVRYSFPSQRKLELNVPLSEWYSPVGEIVSEKLGPGMLLLDSFSFHAPSHTGDAREHPKATIEITPANAHPKQLFFTSTVSRTPNQPMLGVTKSKDLSGLPYGAPYSCRYTFVFRRMACTYSRVSVKGMDSTNSCGSRYLSCPSQSPTRSVTGVVGGERVLEAAVVLVHHRLEIAGSQLQIEGERCSVLYPLSLTCPAPLPNRLQAGGTDASVTADNRHIEMDRSCRHYAVWHVRDFSA